MVAKPIAAARPARSLAESKVRPGVVAFFRFISPFYFHTLLGFRAVKVLHADRLVGAYRDFFDGKARLLVAFRHPYGDEAQLMAYVVAKVLAREAAALGVVFPRKPHARFVHGYEVPLWAGAFERWLLPRVGAVPVYHVKIDRKSIGRIRALMADGDYPLALAPEGQVSYSSEELPRLESGAARICAWCAEDLAAQGRPEEVVLLPVSVHHRWGEASAKDLDRLIGRIEKECGIRPPEAGRSGASRFERLSAIADAALAAAERHYAKFCGAAPPRPGTSGRGERLRDLREAALAAAERALSLKPEGDIIHRVYRIRQAGWDRIFRADIPDPAALPGLERALADRAAGEAWYASRHMELVDLAFYLDFERLKPDDPLALYVETAQNYYDLVMRLEGGNISDRLSLRKREATVIVGEPLRASARLAGFGARKKEAVESLNDDLRRAFIECIHEFQEEG